MKKANVRLFLQGAQNVIVTESRFLCVSLKCGRHSLDGMATHFAVYDLGSNPGGDEIFRARPDRPRVPPNLL